MAFIHALSNYSPSIRGFFRLRGRAFCGVNEYRRISFILALHLNLGNSRYDHTQYFLMCLPGPRSSDTSISSHKHHSKSSSKAAHWHDLPAIIFSMISNVLPHLILSLRRSILISHLQKLNDPLIIPRNVQRKSLLPPTLPPKPSKTSAPQTASPPNPSAPNHKPLSSPMPATAPLSIQHNEV
jgi:hypothetical protein